MSLDTLTQAYVLTIFPAIMIFAAVGDAISMKITNRLIIVGVFTFYAGALLTGMDWQTIAWHTGAGAVLYGIGFLLFCLGMSGGGDLKLISVIGLWIGVEQILPFLIIMSIAGVAVLIMTHLVRNAPIWLIERSEWLKTVITDNKVLPYGIAICIGALPAYMNSVWFELLRNVQVV